MSRKCTILIKDEVKCAVLGLDQDHIDKLKNRFARLVPTRFYQAAFKLGQWDGKIQFFKETGDTYVNLLEEIIPLLENYGYAIKLTDKRKTVVYTPDPIDKHYFDGVIYKGKPLVLRDHQVQVVNDLIANGGGIGKAATSAGKCLHPDTPIIMFDGSTKHIKDIEIGELLLGDDNTPRTVLGRTQGTSLMYKIKPTSNGYDDWICNDKHIMSLVANTDKNGTGGAIKKDGVIDIGIDEYISKGNTFKHTFKQFATGFDGWDSVDFPTDPYMIGLWLGDGSTDQPIIWNIDPEVIEYLYEYAKNNDSTITIYEQKNKETACCGYRLCTKIHKENHILEYFREFKNEDNLKFIPLKYLTSSRTQRLQLLAGLIDSDGYVHTRAGKSSVEIAQKSKPLANAIVMLCRSLGLRATLSEKLVIGNIYNRIYISGEALLDIPCKVLRKKIKNIHHRTNSLRTGFSVEKLPVGEYVGLVVDGNRRFLKGDFTVVHNTFMTGALTKVHEEMDDLRVLTIVPNKTLVRQTHKEYMALGLDAGIYYGDIKKTDHKHLVSTWQSLIISPHMMKDYDVVIVDEVHLAKGKSLQTLLLDYGAHMGYRYGVTGTMPKEDIDKMSINIALGTLVTEVGASTLIEKKILANLNISVIELEHNLKTEFEQYKRDFRKSLTRPEPLTYTQFKDGYLPDYSAEKSYNTKHEEHLNWIAAKLEEIRNEYGNVLVLVDGVKHGESLSKLIDDSYFLSGSDKTDVRESVYEQYDNRDDMLTIATAQIASTGLSINRIFALCYINFGKSGIKVIQSVGRGLRTADDKDFVMVFDFTNDLKYSRRHTTERIKFYKEEKYPYSKEKIKFSPTITNLFD